MTATDFDRKVLFLTCDSCETRDPSFEAPRDSVVHLDEAGQSIVYYATCPEGHRNPIEVEYLTHIAEVRSAVIALSSVLETKRRDSDNLRKISEFELFISGLQIEL